MRELLDEAQLAAYAAEVKEMSDQDYVSETQKQILYAGYTSRHSAADQRAGICYKESVAREKPWLYAQAYNRAANDAGVEIDEKDRERARPPESETL